MRAVAGVSASEPAAPGCAGSGHRSGDFGTSAAAAPPTGRALALVGSALGRGIGPSGPRPSAAFLAQLIATAQQAPQTRQRRRAELHEANASYAAAATPEAWTGRAIYRVM